MSGSFVQELKRRNVFRVAIIYILVSWLLMQIGDVMFPALRLPEWTTTLLVAFLLLGFPVALIFAWAFELTADGVTRTVDVPEGQSITSATGQRINYLIIGVLAIAVVVLLGKDFLGSEDPKPQNIAVTDHSIAVLPFKNQSASEENAEFFAGGLHDELLTLLSKLGDMKVISRTSVERLDPNLSIPEIGTLLGVATVLEGQVQRAGNRLRINVQLIDTEQEGHIWANVYDSELTAENVFDVQGNIARTIANALQAELSPHDEEALQDVPTTDTEALEKYLLGMQIAKRQSYGALQQAEEYLRQATDLDPTFADAWAGLGLVLAEQFQTGALGLQDLRELAEPAIETALSLRPDSASAHATRARAQLASGDGYAAERSFEKALSLAPGNSYVLEAYGQSLRIIGDLAKAKEILERGLELDPLSPALMFELGKVEMYTGNPDRFVELANQIMIIDPSNVYAYTGLLQANLWRGRFDESMPWFNKMMAEDPLDYETWAHLALDWEVLGESELADRYMARAVSLGADSPVVAKCISQIEFMRGNLSGALATAQKVLSEDFGDRWDSDRVLLRTIRDAALETGELDEALQAYRLRRVELFSDMPEINIDNVLIATDLALLVRANGDETRSKVLVDSALRWDRENRPEGVHGYTLGINDVELLTLDGQTDEALRILAGAVEDGWRADWPWIIYGANLRPLQETAEFTVIEATLKGDMARQRDAALALPYMGETDLRDRPAE